MRTTDQRLLNIQNRMREGTVTEEDHKELSKRIVGRDNELKSFFEPPWNTAPIITFQNDLRTIINHRAVTKKAIEDKTPLIVCVANDTFSVTQNLPGYLPLVEGMPVMLTRSLFTELGISNGTIGIFRQLIYEDTNEIDDEKIKNDEEIDKNRFPSDTIYIRKPIFALIELLNPKQLSKMNGLPPNIIPIPLEKQTFNVDLSKILPPSLRKQYLRVPIIKITRCQFPLVPAYSYTSHKSQGQNVPKGVLDLKFPPPPFAKELATAYVPITRVKTMKDLAFYREFPLSALQILPSIKQKNEIQRLE